MPVFAYKGRDTGSKTVSGSVEAANPAHARSLLREKGYFVTALKEQAGKGVAAAAGTAAVSKGSGSGLSYKFSFFKKKVKLDDLVIFSRQFATLVRAGLSITTILSTVREQTASEYLQEVLQRVQRDVEAGETLSDAFSKHPAAFSSLFVSLVRAGELGGVLDQVMEEIANYYERDHDLRQKIKSAFTYPAVVLILAFLVVVFLLSYVVPVFAQVYSQLRTQLPLPTRILVAISKIAQKWWWLIIGSFFGSIMFYNYYKESPKGRPVVDRIKLQMPLFANLNLKSSLARFSRTFALLLGAGVTMIQAIEMVSEVAINSVVSSRISNMSGPIQEGESLSAQFRKSALFPPMLVQMVTVGEETGNLESMLLTAANFYDREVDYIVRRLTTLIEPLLTVLLGFIVGFIAISLYLPIFNLINAMGK